MNITESIENVSDNIDGCISMFVYGSYARNPDYANDCEIAVLLDSEDMAPKMLNKFETNFNNGNIKFFPFSKQRFVRYNLRTTFTKPIFYHEIIKDGFTVYGDKVLENISKPKIKKSDLKRDIGFQIGQIFAALKAHRYGESSVPIELTYKSGILGSRLKHIIDTGDVLTGYNNIVSTVEDPILHKLLDLRINNDSVVEKSTIHDTLLYLRSDVEPYIESAESKTY